MRLLLIAALLPGAAAAAVTLRESSGLVQVRLEGSDRWRPAAPLPRTLSAGDAVRTGFNARAKLELGAGAVLEASGNAQFSVADAAAGGDAVNLLFGSVRLGAKGLGGRTLELRTPTASARARSVSASWTASVSGGGNASFQVESGLVGVESVRGGRLLLREGERVAADMAGLHEPARAPTPAQARRSGFAESMRRELALELAREEPLRRAGAELRRAEHELGRVLVDASGARVRVEDHVTRPAADRVQYVSLNGRAGSGLSYLAWSGTYDRALPRDLAPVFAALGGRFDAAAAWTLTGCSVTRSNGVDRIVETRSGGHQVDLNSNANPLDDVGAPGRAFFAHLFDSQEVRVNGVLKRGWTGVNITEQGDAAAINVPGANLGASNSTFPDAGAARRVTTESYQDGTFIRWDERGLDFGGGAQGGPWPGGAPRLQSIGASEFGGRTVDVIVSPAFGALP